MNISQFKEIKTHLIAVSSPNDYKDMESVCE